MRNVAIPQATRTAAVTQNMKRFCSRCVWNINHPSTPATMSPISTDCSSNQNVKNGKGIAIRLLSHDAAA